VAVHLTPGPVTVYRVGRLPDPFTWRPPRGDLVDAPGPTPELGGGRWDAPGGEFDTLYCADSPVVAFAEAIAPFRPGNDLDQEILDATDEELPDPEFDIEIRSGHLPATFFEPLHTSGEPPLQGRALGEATFIVGELVDVSHPDTHHELNTTLGSLLGRFGLDRFDRGVMMSQDRRITRRVAAYLRATTNAVGVSFECRFIAGTCFALWDRGPTPIAPGDVSPVTNCDPDLRRAADLLHITMDA